MAAGAALNRTCTARWRSVCLVKAKGDGVLGVASPMRKCRLFATFALSALGSRTYVQSSRIKGM